MPHYKCVACKTRLYSAACPADLFDDLCPGCGSLLEPVGELAEIVGFQSIKPREDLLPLRKAIRSHVPPDAVAKAIALPPPDESP
jgi:hypothetical protein